MREANAHDNRESVSSPFRRILPWVIPFTYACAAALPNTLEAFSLPKGSSHRDIALGVVYAACSLISNVPSSVLFAVFIGQQLLSLVRCRLPKSEVLALALAAMPAAFAASFSVALARDSCEGIGVPRLANFLMGFVVLHTFLARAYGTSQLLLSVFGQLGEVRRLWNHDVQVLAQFRRDLQAHGADLDFCLKEDDTIDFSKSAEKFYTQLWHNKVGPNHWGAQRTHKVVPLLQITCLLYVLGLLPVFVHMVHKGLSQKLDGLGWAFLGGCTHMAFYLKMAWSFIPAFMRYVDTLFKNGYSRLSIFLLLIPIFACFGLSGTGVMNVALHQSFDDVVNGSLLQAGQPYARYWNFLIQPVIGPLAAVAAGIFCNGTGLILLLLRLLYNNGETACDRAINEVSKAIGSGQLDAIGGVDAVHQIEASQCNWSLARSSGLFCCQRTAAQNDHPERVPLLHATN